ncbi:DEAD-box type RNA helicase, partial [Kickxella alabastrina]
LVYNLCTDYPHVYWKQKIGIITPYKQQLRKLVDRFRGFFGQNIMDAIEFNTVDGFQGQEKDIIIFSCVRAGGSGVGFLADERRMNVGLTRARKSLFVLGNADLLVSSPLWKQLIADSKSRGLLRASSLPLFGCEVHSGKRFDNLFSDQAADAQGGVDGEGDKSEFIMEAIDELALEKRNEATIHDDAPIDSSADETVGSAMEVDTSRELPSVAAQGKFSHSRRPSNASSISSDREHFAQKPNAVSREPINGDVRPESNIQMSASTAFRRPARSPARVLNTSRPPINLHAQMALERKKQHSSLFIPSKRGGQGGGMRGSATGKAPSGKPLNYTLPAESLPPAVLREFAHPPLPPPMLPLPLPPSSSPPPSRSLSKDNSRSNRRNSRDCSRSPLRRSEKHRDKRDDRRDDRRSRDRRDGSRDRDRRDRSRDRHRHGNSKDSSKRSSDTGTPSTSSVKRPRRKGGLFRPSTSTENVGRRSRSDRDYDGKVDRDDLISGMLERRY